MLEPEVAVPLDDGEGEHVPVVADELQRGQRPEDGSVGPQPCVMKSSSVTTIAILPAMLSHLTNTH